MPNSLFLPLIGRPWWCWQKSDGAPVPASLRQDAEQRRQPRYESKDTISPHASLRVKGRSPGGCPSIRSHFRRRFERVSERYQPPMLDPGQRQGRRRPSSSLVLHRRLRTSRCVAPCRVFPPARQAQGVRSYPFVVGAVLIFLSIIACRTPGSLTSPGTTRVVTDELGRRVEVSAHPQRIISLAPSVTEMLFALGVADRVVGVTTLCDYPPEATAKEKVGDVLAPSLERIVALAPDLVIISTATQLEMFAKRLVELGIPLYVVKANRLEDVLQTLRHLGDLTGERERAEALVRSLQARIEQVVERTQHLPRPRVLLVIQRDPLIVAGRGAFLTDLMEKAGGHSITADAEREWTLYSIESVLARAPEVLVLPSREGQSRRLADLQWPALASTPALRNKRIYAINMDLLMRPGPRLVEGLEELARMLHPEAFR